jgi:hypothetical protein
VGYLIFVYGTVRVYCTQYVLIKWESEALIISKAAGVCSRYKAVGHLDPVSNIQAHNNTILNTSLWFNMTKNKNKFYAVTKGYIAPAIFGSWYTRIKGFLVWQEADTSCRAIACVSTTGFPSNEVKGFDDLISAESYMEKKGFAKYDTFHDLVEQSLEADTSSGFYYAVAKGHEKGIYKFYR